MSRFFSGVAALALSFGSVVIASAQSALPVQAALAAVQFAQPGWRPGPGWDRDIDVRCASQNFQYNLCQVDPGIGARVYISQQISHSACVEGQTWGWNRGGVWVSQGCEAVFRVQRRWAEGGPGPGQGGPGPGGPVGGPGPGGWQPGAGWNSRFEVSCGSPQRQYAFCAVDLGAAGRVAIRKRTSDARCAEGRSWGWNRAGIWVDKGCSAIFLVDRRWR